MSKPSESYDYAYEEKETEDYAQGRKAWRIVSWMMVVLTIVLNLLIIGILLVRQNAYTVYNKAILFLAFFDLLYGMFVSPFFVENYIDLHWDQSSTYCKFYEYFFTFHDLYIAITLVLISTYVSLKFSGADVGIKHRKLIVFVLTTASFVLPIALAIPTAYRSSIFIDNPPPGLGSYKKECRSLDSISMILSYCIASSLLFCFTMSFLHSLCIVGSPFLKDVYERREYNQRWRLMLSLSLVNIFYIISGFLLNFKEISRFAAECCVMNEPFKSIDNTTYEIWSFVLLIAEPFFRPLVFLIFYFTYLMDDPMAY